MINSLDEAIKHCEEEAGIYEKEGSLNQESFMPLNEFLRYRVECLKCAKEHRQLAEWLRELKEVKTLVRVTEKIWHQNARGGLIDVVDGYDILFSEHKQLKEMFEEVNADDDCSEFRTK